jgi:hypothetical protein
MDGNGEFLYNAKIEVTVSKMYYKWLRQAFIQQMQT